MPLDPEEQKELDQLRQLAANPPQSDLGYYDMKDLEREQERIEYQDLKSKFKMGLVDDMLNRTKSFMVDSVKPILNVPKFAEEERLRSRELIQEAIDNPSAKNVAFGVLGALGYAFSPISGFTKAVVEEPVRGGMQATGAPEWATEFVANSARTAADLIPYGSVFKGLSALVKPETKLVENAIKFDRWTREAEIMAKHKRTLAEEASKISEAKRVAEEATLPPAELERRIAAREAIDNAVIPEEMRQPINELQSPKVKQEVNRMVTDAAQSLEDLQFDRSKRIFRNIGELLSLGDLKVEDIPDILRRYEMSPTQFAKLYEESVSFGGRILRYHSQVAKKLNKAFEDSPEALEILQKAYKQEAMPHWLDMAADKAFAVRDWWRSSLVSQVATTARNTASNVGRLTVSAFDEALQGAIRGTVGAEGDTLKQMGEGFNILTATMSRMSPTARNRLMSILDSPEGEIVSKRLLSMPVDEATFGSKISYFMGTLNRWSESFFRKIGFEAKMRQLLERAGAEWETIDPKMIPDEFFREATDYAMEMTWASRAKSKAARQFIKAWADSPLVMVNPFPNFNYANAYPFLLEHSPIGFLKTMSPGVLKELVSGDPARFSKAASRATLGTLMFYSALAIRNSDIAGERWDEVKVGRDLSTGRDKVASAQPFAPFSQYLFAAEHFTHPERLQASDYIKMATGLTRTAGTGLVLVDWLRQRYGEPIQQSMKMLGGQLIGGFTTPARTLSDFYAAIDPEQNIQRDYRDSPFMGPTMQNIPGMAKFLPPRVSSSDYRTQEQTVPIAWNIPGGVTRQLIGVSARTKDPILKEMDRIGMDTSVLNAKTGVPEADRIISGKMAPVMMMGFKAMIRDNPNYNVLSDSQKEMALRFLVTEAKDVGRRWLEQNRPDLAAKVKWENLPRYQRDILKSKGVNVPWE